MKEVTMRKLITIIILLCSMCIATISYSKANSTPSDIEKTNICRKGFGFWYVLDPYANVWSTWEVYNQSKVFITNVEDNSPAAKAGLKIGDEIKKVNGNRVVKYKDYDFANYLTSQQSIKLDIKSTNGEKRTVTISKGDICKTRQIEPVFDSYWGQVCTFDLDGMAENLSYIGRINNKLTAQARQDFNYKQNKLEEWYNRKAQFKNGYNLCLSNNSGTTDTNNCLNRLIDRTLSTVIHEQNLEMQRNTLQAQQQMQQKQINALNNLSNSLRNQHVEHSGTFNVYSDVNVRGDIYHHFGY